MGLWGRDIIKGVVGCWYLCAARTVAALSTMHALRWDDVSFVFVSSA